MRKIIGLFMASALLVTACGGGDDDVAAEEPADEPTEQIDDSTTGSTGDTTEPEEDEPEPEEDEGSSPSNGSSSALCSLGAEYDGVDPFDGVSILDGEEFFEVAGDLWDQAAAAAPGELQDDIAAIRGGIGELQSVLEQYDYNFLDENLQQGIENIDTTALDEAGASFSDYMNEVCGIEFNAGTTTGPDAGPAPTFDADDIEDLQNLDPNDTAAVLQQIFGIDAELAQCLNDELGGLDPENIDPAVLTQPVCGTTLLEVVSGVGG